MVGIEAAIFQTLLLGTWSCGTNYRFRSRVLAVNLTS